MFLAVAIVTKITLISVTIIIPVSVLPLLLLFSSQPPFLYMLLKSTHQLLTIVINAQSKNIPKYQNTINWQSRTLVNTVQVPTLLQPVIELNCTVSYHAGLTSIPKYLRVLLNVSGDKLLCG